VLESVTAPIADVPVEEVKVVIEYLVGLAVSSGVISVAWLYRLQKAWKIGQAVYTVLHTGSPRGVIEAFSQGAEAAAKLTTNIPGQDQLERIVAGTAAAIAARRETKGKRHKVSGVAAINMAGEALGIRTEVKGDYVSIGGVVNYNTHTGRFTPKIEAKVNW
jgi:hypothetical protein